MPLKERDLTFLFPVVSGRQMLQARGGELAAKFFDLGGGFSKKCLIVEVGDDRRDGLADENHVFFFEAARGDGASPHADAAGVGGFAAIKGDGVVIQDNPGPIQGFGHFFAAEAGGG